MSQISPTPGRMAGAGVSTAEVVDFTGVDFMMAVSTGVGFTGVHFTMADSTTVDFTITGFSLVDR